MTPDNVDYNSPIAGTETTDIIEPQLIPAGIQVKGIITGFNHNPEYALINMDVKALEYPATLDPAKPIASMRYSINLPNSAKDTPEQVFNAQVSLKRLKNAFGIPDTRPICAADFINRQVLCMTKERKMKPDKLAKYGPGTDVDTIIEVLS